MKELIKSHGEQTNITEGVEDENSGEDEVSAAVVGEIVDSDEDENTEEQCQEEIRNDKMNFYNINIT